MKRDLELLQECMKTLKDKLKRTPTVEEVQQAFNELKNLTFYEPTNKE
jgi:hypothetical protein